MPDGKPEEFDEDCSSILCNLAAYDNVYSYSNTEIDLLLNQLGIKWEDSKTIPWGFRAPYLGFIWGLEDCTVSVPEQKKQKLPCSHRRMGIMSQTYPP